MLVKNHRLYLEEDKPVTFVDTPNQSGSVNPLYLIMHYTAGQSLDGAVSWLSQKRARASAHVVIGRDGEVVQMVAFNRKAWHAGASSWGELTSMNQYAIGIELVNAGKLQQKTDGEWVDWANHKVPPESVVVLTHKNESMEAGWQAYPERQLETAITVASALHEKYGFVDILGHEDVAPARKVDPGPAFPMISFVSKVLGRESC